MNKVYTIIVTYNAMKWISKCIRCLKESTIHTDIIVVDNCSTDETVEYISTAFQDVIIIQNKKNRGFGQANNQGLEYAYKHSGTHFFLCNQDLYVKPDAIEKMVNIQNEYDLCVVSPIQMNGSFSMIDGGFYNSFIQNPYNLEFVSDIITSTAKDYYAVSYVPAAAWMLTRNTLETIGGFDPLFFHYGEDNHYSSRLIYHKKIMAVVPSAIVAHDREFKGNINAFKKYAPCSNLVNAFSDPNDPILRLTSKRIVALGVITKHILFDLIKFKFVDAKNSICSLATFIGRLKDVKESVKSNRIINHNWLEI